MNAAFIIRFSAILLCASIVHAGDFAIDAAHFVTIDGISYNEKFALSGEFVSAPNVMASQNNITVSGKFRTSLPAIVPAPVELIVNGSFENTDATFVRDSFGLMSLGGRSTAIPGWTTAEPELAWVDNNNIFGAATPFGSYSLELTGYHDGRPYGGVSQSIATTVGQTYRLSLSLGSNADYPGAGGQKSVTVCAGSAAAILTFIPTNSTGNDWKTLDFLFVAISETTTVEINGLISSGNYLGLDNVSVMPSDPIPENQNLVTNGSFEIDCPITFQPDSNGVMPLLPGSTEIPAWTTIATQIGWGVNGNVFGPRTPYGELFLDLSGYRDAPPYGGITQMLSTVPGQSYRLKFSLGVDMDHANFKGPIEVLAVAGSTSNLFTFAPTGLGNQWGEFSLDFVAETASTPLSFVGVSALGGAYLGLDNISVAVHDEQPPFEISAVEFVDGALSFQFPTAGGRTYSIESSDSLETGDWRPIQEFETQTNGNRSRVTVRDTFLGSRRFYRITSAP